MNDVVLSLHNIARVFTQGERLITVLNHVHLDIRKGQILALVGQSGSGKSTLLQIAGLLDSPTEGDVMINNRNLSNADDTERTQTRCKHIGFIYQFHHLLPEFSALENVALPQMINGTSKANAMMRAKELLESLGLSERLNHRPAALSGGEQQRVAIARALANKPDLLLADEPTGNLDPSTAEIVFDMMLRIAKEKQVAMLIATHNPDLAARMDRVVHLEKGELR